MKLNQMAFAKAAGVLWALGLVLISLIAMGGSYGTEMVDFLAPFYLGYDLSVGGIVIGAIWAFLDAFIGCWIFAWLYNRFAV
jgi:hypothetical protein